MSEIISFYYFLLPNLPLKISFSLLLPQIAGISQLEIELLNFVLEIIVTIKSNIEGSHLDDTRKLQISVVIQNDNCNILILLINIPIN